MAEVSGLVVSAVALASLFNSCIDLFDRYQLYRQHTSSYHLACDKVELLKTRLERWGDLCRIGKSHCENPASRRISQDRHHLVACSLADIQDLLRQTSVLRGRYEQASANGSLASKLALLATRPTISSSQQNRPIPVGIPSKKGSVGVRRRALWAIYDKQKFDRLILELSFLVENLEKATTLGLGMMPSARSDESTKKPPRRLPQERTEEDKLAHHRETENQKPVNQTKTTQPPEYSGSEVKKDQQKYDKIYSGTQENIESLGVIGDVLNDDAKTRSKFSIDQRNSSRAVGIMGDVSPEVVVRYPSNQG